MKKIFRFLFSILLIFSVAFLLEHLSTVDFKKFVNAEDSSLETSDQFYIEGVQVKGNASYNTTDTGLNGMKFVANFKNYTPESGYTATYGIVLAYHHVDDLDDFYVEKGKIINEKGIKYKETENVGDDKTIYLTITGMPASSRETVISARTYVKLTNSTDNTDVKYIYSSTVKEDSLVDACRKVYNITEDDNDLLADKNGQTNLIVGLATHNRVKVTDSENNITYFEDLGYRTSAQQKNDTSTYTTSYANKTIELVRGAYTYPINLSSGAKLYGANKDIEINESGERVEPIAVGETIITNYIRNLADGNENIIVNGCTMTGNCAFILRDNQSNVELSNNRFLYTGNQGIYEEKNKVEIASQTHENIVIKNNYFYSDKKDYTQDIYLLGDCNGISIINNIFKNDLESLATKTVDEVTSWDDYPIYIACPVSGSLTEVKDNNFKHLGANYIVSLGDGLVSQRGYKLTVENNQMCPSESGLNGNGICAYKINSNSEINIIHNTNFKISQYYNAILVSAQKKANSTTTIKPTINILYNDFYHYTIDKPDSRNNINSSYIRIGIAVASDTNINLLNNYIDSGSINKGGYETNSNASANSSSYTPTSSTLSTADITQKAYDLDNEIDKYLNEIEDYKTNNNLTSFTFDAWYDGKDENNIKRYISFNDLYKDYLEIVNGELKYINSNTTYYYYRVANYKNIGKVDSNKSNYDELYEKFNALLTTAYAYDDQGNQIEYDETMKRRMINVSPETATEYNHIILDCSSFVNAVYYNTFGSNILSNEKITTDDFLNYAYDNSSNLDVVRYIRVEEVAESEKTTLLNNIWKELQIGDLVVYQKNDDNDVVAGHVMMYIGDDKFMHCTGASYKYFTNESFENSFDDKTDKEESDGAIQILSAKNVFTIVPGSSRYLFQDEMIRFCVLRPLNNQSTMSTITAVAEKRLSIGRIEIEKTSNFQNKTVKSGDTITYSIKVVVKGKQTLTNVPVEDFIPENCSFVEGSQTGGTKVGRTYDESTGKLSWILGSISSGTTLTYKVKVDDDLDLHTLIISNPASLDGISTNSLTNVVGEGLDFSELSTKISNISAKSYIPQTFDFINEAYYQIIGENLFSDVETPETIITAYKNNLDNDKDGVYSIENCSYASKIALNLYGGYVFRNQTATITDNNRVRCVKTDYLECGDIIVVYNQHTDKYSAYLYVDSTHIYGTDGGIVSIKVSERSTNRDGKPTDIYKTCTQFVEQLEAYEYYLVLRPNTWPTA